MTPSELLSLFRKEVSDQAEPYLWSDEEFYIYLNDAQDVFVRLIGGIADRRGLLTKLTYNEGDQFKKYDDRILRIKEVIDEENRRIEVQNLESLGPTVVDDYGGWYAEGIDDGRTGDIKYVITDVQNNDMQLYPIPDHDGHLRLFIYRRPMDPITPRGEGELEVASYYHLNLLNWAKYKAYMKQDGETFDQSKAEDFRKAFVDGLTDAKTEKAAREDRKRLMAYGGI